MSSIQQRTNSIKNIPRLTFLPPQNPQTIGTQQSSPIFFCQSGCQLEFYFNNISNISTYNDGNLFSITLLNDNNQNYIKWNGSNTNGQELTTFYLKEIYFQAPAKDVVGQITYDKSIQMFFAFVNEQYNNLMIVISVIGQANNLGNQPQTNGFKLLDTLAQQIPLRGDDVQLSNLKNFNLGTLLPSNRSFFSTLTNNNNIQYISMKTIIDVPLTFFNNMVSRVAGGTNAYKQKINNFIQNTPINPPGTFIFYNENIQPIGAGQALVCNANCEQVPGKESQLSPSIGTRTTRQIEPQQRDDSHIKNIAQGIQTEEEIPCEEEEVWPDEITKVTPEEKKITTEQTADKAGSIILIFVMVLFMIVGIIGVFVSLKIKFDLSSFKNIFSSYFWNKDNAPWIAFGLSGLTIFLVCIIIWIVFYIKSNKPENENKNYKPWISLLIGGTIIIITIGLILFKSNLHSNTDIQKLWKGKDTSPFPSSQLTSPFSGNSLPQNFKSKFPNLSSKFSSPFSSKSPSAPPLQPINTSSPDYKLSHAISQLSQNPNLIDTPQGKQIYQNAMQSYKQLPSNQKNIFKKSFGNQLFNPSSNFSKGITQSTGTVDPAIKSALSSEFQKYSSLAYITPQMQKEIMNLAQSNPNNPILSQLSQQVASLTNGGMISPQTLQLLIKFASNPNLP